jgi:hypothetical protein
VADASWIIKVGNMTYNSTVSGLTTPKQLTNTQALFNPVDGIPIYPSSTAGIAEKGMFYIYHYLSIPAGFKAQTYRSKYYLNVEAM